MKSLALCVLFLVPAPIPAQTPGIRVADKPAAVAVADSMIRLPERVTGGVGDFIEIKAQTNCTFVRWVLLDGGLALFPMDLLRDTRTAVVVGKSEGQFRVLAYTAAADTPSEPAIVLVVVGKSPVPPGPQPPGPTPPNPPTPVPTKSPRIILVYESTAKLPKDQHAALMSRTVEELLAAKCKGGDAGWRRWDRDVKFPDKLTDELREWKRIWEAAKPGLTQLPAVVVIGDDGAGKVYALPPNEQGLLDLINKVAG